MAAAVDAAADEQAKWISERRMFPKVGHTLGLPDLPRDARPDLPIAVAVLPFFDLKKRGRVSHSEWQRGVQALGIDGLGDPTLWDALTELFDRGGAGEIALSQVEYLLPVDPMVGMLLSGLVRAVVSVVDDVGSVKRKGQAQAGSAQSRAVLSMRRRILAPALAGWVKFVSLQRRLTKLTRRLTRNGELRALLTWRDAAAERRELARMFRRGMHRELAHAFDAWAGRSEEAAETLGRLRRFGTRLCQGALSRAWASWADAGEERRRMRRFMKRCLSGGCLHALNRWVEVAEERRRLRTFMRCCLHGGLNRAWLRWLESADERRHLQRFGRRLQQRGLLSAWNAWCDIGLLLADLAHTARKHCSRSAGLLLCPHASLQC